MALRLCSLLSESYRVILSSLWLTLLHIIHPSWHYSSPLCPLTNPLPIPYQSCLLCCLSIHDSFPLLSTLLSLSPSLTQPHYSSYQSLTNGWPISYQALSNFCLQGYSLSCI